MAKIRIAEANEAGKRFGVEYTVLDNHDGELMPTLANRLKVIREIRKWNADVVIAPRPNDYHPDHRYTGILVQDAAYMVIVPNVAPEVAPLEKIPFSCIQKIVFKSQVRLIPISPLTSMMYLIRKFMQWPRMNLNFLNGCHGLRAILKRSPKMKSPDWKCYLIGVHRPLLKRPWNV